MQTFWQDVRYAVRLMARSPGFTLVAVITLGLGIGANTAIYSVVHAVLLRPLPYEDPDRLVVPSSVNNARGGEDGNVTYADYLDWKKEGVFEHVATIDDTTTSADLSGDDGEPERVSLALVTEDYFTVLRAAPVHGRLLQPADYALSGAARQVVISDGLWKRRYGSDPGIVGKTIRLNGRPYPVAGIVEGRRTWPADRDVFLPFVVGPNPGDLLRRDNMLFVAIGRLRPDRSVEETDAVLAGMARRLETEHPESRTGWTNRATPLLRFIVGAQVRTSLLMLLTAVGCVLLIACVNVSNLLLTRAAARGQELAIRLAHGAGRLRLIRQLLTEGMLLALLGGLTGLLFAFWGVGFLKTVVPEDTPRLGELGIRPIVLLFTLGVSLLTAVLCGLIPAWQAARADIQLALRESARSGGLQPRRQRVKNALVVGEVALSLMLLVGAGLMIRSFARVQRIDPGLKVDRLLTMELRAPTARYPQDKVLPFYSHLVESVATTPGVSSAAISSTMPFNGGGFYLGRVFLAEGWPEPPAGKDAQGLWNVVGPGYFRTTGMRLVRGRDFNGDDTANGNPVIIVNESLARSMFPGQDPIGKRIRSWRDENQLREIVGVVADVRYFGRDDELRGLVYVPHAQNAWRSMVLNVKTRGDPAGVIAAIRARIRELDPDLAIANLRTVTTLLERSVAPRRAGMLLLALFAALAGALAAIGLYGVLSQVVLQRVHEIGVRMALGARSQDVSRMIVRQGMKLAGAGIGIGLLGAFALTRLMRGLLYGVSATDPATYAGITLLLAAVALVACFVPALRAARVDPMVALRHE
jgi:putative ABC transport system permease protein